MVAGQHRSRLTRWAAVLILASPLVATTGCVQPPAVSGAPCGCPAGYHCDRPGDPAGVCVPGPGPDAAAAAVDDGQSRAPNRCRHAGQALTRALRPREYARSVRDLIGVEAPTPAWTEEPPNPQTGFFGRVVPRGEALVVAEQLVQMARSLADRATVPECPTSGDRAACRDEFVDRFGLRAFRRPLSPDERATLINAYATGGGDHPTSARAVMAVALASPSFLYRTERGDPAAPTPSGDLHLTGWERATRLSYFFVGTTPDDALLQAAAAGQLDRLEGLRAQVARLLDDPRSEATLLDLYGQWWRLDVPPEPSTGNAMPAAVAGTLKRSAEALILDLVRTRDLPLPALFQDPGVYGDRDLASYYDLSPRDRSAFGRLEPGPGQSRFGLLTMPALLSSLAHGEQSAPVLRGAFVLREILCRDVSAPPGMVSVPMPDPTRSTRQRYQEHTVNSTCRGCHGLFDNAGFGLDNYDGHGRWRVDDNGHPIDLSNLDVATIPYESLPQLASLLGEHESAAGCAVRHWFRYALGRRESPEEQDFCTLPALEQAYVAGGKRTRPLLEALATSDAFITIDPRR